MTPPAATSTKPGWQANDMKIGRIETFYVPPRWLFVRVESDDGAVGWGEASLEGHARPSTALRMPCATFIGHDPGARGHLEGRLPRRFYRGAGADVGDRGLEQALWDLKGKSSGCGLGMLAAGARKIRAYAGSAATGPTRSRCGQARRDQAFRRSR